MPFRCVHKLELHMPPHHHPSKKPPGSFSEPGGILNLVSACPAVLPAANAVRASRYLELAAAYCEMARMYWARSKALGSGQFFWLRLPLSWVTDSYRSEEHTSELQ